MIRKLVLDAIGAVDNQFFFFVLIKHLDTQSTTYKLKKKLIGLLEIHSW
jgi:predicted tellurium resistance membrane protein TerC